MDLVVYVGLLFFYGDDDNRRIWRCSSCKIHKTQYIYVFFFWEILANIIIYFHCIKKTTKTEYVVCIVTMLISCGVFAYAVNQIGSIFELLGR